MGAFVKSAAVLVGAGLAVGGGMVVGAYAGEALVDGVVAGVKYLRNRKAKTGSKAHNFDVAGGAQQQAA